MHHNEQGAGHGTESEEALGKIGYALFDHVRTLELPVAFIVAAFVIIVDDFCDAQGFRVKGSLGNETIGEGKT